MEKPNNLKRNLNAILYAGFTIVLLFAVMLTMINNIYTLSEEEAFEKLHMETLQIKRDINLQMLSDRENLVTMANLAAKLKSDGEGYDVLLNSFKEIGLFENIGILLPDNRFVTKLGTINMEGKISFSEEAKKGEYISGRVKDFTNDKIEVVRSAVPVRADDGTIIAMMYGVISLEKFHDRYIDDARALGADLFVLNGENGNFILDTKHNSLGNIAELASTKYKDDFSYDKMITDLTNSKSGYSAFMSLTTDNYLYAHYAPLDFEKWQIMLAKPEQTVFTGAKSTISYLTFMAALIFLIMLAYVVFVFRSERAYLKTNISASRIRKRLLGVNQEIGKMYEALEKVTVFAKARSAFFVDTYGEDYSYINSDFAQKLLVGEERRYFITTLLNYAARNREEHGVEVYLAEITADKQLHGEMPEFYGFITAHGIKKINFAVIVTNSSNTNLLGVINPKKSQINELLKEIAICFSMAVYNRKHLTKTEALAMTDALTGVANRMAFKQDTKLMSEREIEELICVYIDVNELNYYNNKYGHAAGDQMLVYIADVLKGEFPDSRIYRMGGDEFLIFSEGLELSVIKERLDRANGLIEEMKYHISIGIKHKDKQLSIEELINEAEKIMYEEKAKYYQHKGLSKVAKMPKANVDVMTTGIKEVDACLSIMSMRYHGVYNVSLKTDTAVKILAPSYYFGLSNEENKFSDVMKQYIHDIAQPKYHRALLSFLKYDILERQLRSGHSPRLSYTKIDGGKVTLSIYMVSENEGDDINTIWTFENNDD